MTSTSCQSEGSQEAEVISLPDTPPLPPSKAAVTLSMLYQSISSDHAHQPLHPLEPLPIANPSRQFSTAQPDDPDAEYIDPFDLAHDDEDERPRKRLRRPRGRPTKSISKPIPNPESVARGKRPRGRPRRQADVYAEPIQAAMQDNKRGSRDSTDRSNGHSINYISNGNNTIDGFESNHSNHSNSTDVIIIADSKDHDACRHDVDESGLELYQSPMPESEYSSAEPSLMQEAEREREKQEEEDFFNNDPMLDELRALLEAEAEDSGDENESYEARRQRKLKANETLLAQLGLAGGGASLVTDAGQGASEDSHISPTKSAPSNSTGKGEKVGEEDSRQSQGRRYNKYQRRLKFAEDGTTTGIPPEGTQLEVAYVDLPTIRDRARNEYIFVHDMAVEAPYIAAEWSELTDEEYAFSEDDGAASHEAEDLQDQGEINELYLDDGPKKKKTKKKGKTSTPKIEKEPKVKKEAKEKVRKLFARRIGPAGEAVATGDEYGTTCHQCRRKTPDPKMRCRNHEGEHVCPLFFCKRCIEIRYGMDFDPDSRTFKCPRCEGYCNCSICLRKSGLGNILDSQAGKKDLRAPTLTAKLKDAQGRTKYKSVREYVAALLGKDKLADGGLLRGRQLGEASSRSTKGKRGRPRLDQGLSKAVSDGEKLQLKQEGEELSTSLRGDAQGERPSTGNSLVDPRLVEASSKGETTRPESPALDASKDAIIGGHGPDKREGELGYSAGVREAPKEKGKLVVKLKWNLKKEPSVDGKSGPDTAREAANQDLNSKLNLRWEEKKIKDKRERDSNVWVKGAADLFSDSSDLSSAESDDDETPYSRNPDSLTQGLRVEQEAGYRPRAASTGASSDQSTLSSEAFPSAEDPSSGGVGGRDIAADYGDDIEAVGNGDKESRQEDLVDEDSLAFGIEAFGYQERAVHPFPRHCNGDGDRQRYPGHVGNDPTEPLHFVGPDPGSAASIASVLSYQPPHGPSDEASLMISTVSHRDGGGLQALQISPFRNGYLDRGGDQEDGGELPTSLGRYCEGTRCSPDEGTVGENDEAVVEELVNLEPHVDTFKFHADTLVEDGACDFHPQ
ncbi:hypothetical protein IE53DRAFT_412339 [Violaceomyces palustris]|uniref:Uncharacterized protein n=1 Tax=Violaceomyces palustris TaxID=1673888 RepID=A0ACD0NRF9_9BASI|nr:hypothetical protein IE53DRAFT_412339 [Violaceomyces palustris]